MKILVVDDEIKIRNVIKEYLTLNDYEVDDAVNGIEALEKFKVNKYDLIILDVMMPKMDGNTCAKKIREVSNIPIIMLTAKSEEDDMLFSFSEGVDDYMTKPFSPRELIARVKAILNRNSIKTDYKFGELTINTLSREVKIRDEVIKLTFKEYELLLFLVKNKDIVISREKLLSNIWGYNFYGDDRTVDTHIKTLRANLKEYRENIVTYRGVGYKFEYKD